MRSQIKKRTSSRVTIGHPWALSTSRLGGRLNAGHPGGDPQSTGRKVKDDDG